MARCFLTGIEFPLQQGFVLNRRDARDLLNTLKDRVASLQRVIEQLSPLDAHEPKLFGRAHKDGFAPKRHRLICKAVADGLASGFPEIELFQNWPDYRARARRTALRIRHNDPAREVADEKEAPAAEPKSQQHEAGS